MSTETPGEKVERLLTALGVHRSRSGIGGKHAYPIDRNPAKHQTRMDTLERMKRSVFWLDGQLHCDWFEICGDKDAMCAWLIAHDLLAPGYRYIGINNNPAIIEGNRADYAPLGNKTEWVCGDAVEYLGDRDRPGMGKVGIVVYDTTESLCGDALPKTLRVLLSFSEHQKKRLGGFLLVTNHSMRGKGGQIARFGRILTKHCGRDIPENAYTEYIGTDTKAKMRMMRLTYG
jgi:hypothetical protein